MKNLLLAAILGFTFLFPITSVYADVWVNGYTRSNGTYVQGYYRSSPDGNPYNNWSFPGNTNPYTGVTAGGSVSSYLNNYYGSSGSSYSPSTYTPTYAPTYTPTYAPTYSSCPSNSYSDGLGSCKCTYGYVVSGGSCVNANTLCHSQLGIMSSYDSYSKSCTCDPGYEIGTSGLCTYKSYNSGSYSTGYYSSGVTTASCPKNSSESLTDSTKCTCNSGYQVNATKDACVKIKPLTSDQRCKNSFGSMSTWTGNNSDGEPLCNCLEDAQWNSDRTACESLPTCGAGYKWNKYVGTCQPR